MADVGFTPVRGNRNEIANTPLEDGQFLFETESGNGNKVYADVLRDDNTIERVGIMGDYVDRNGDTINGNLTINGRLTVNDKIVANGDMEFTSSVGTTINLKDIFKYVYPVGSIYMSTNNTNPANLFGGSWVAWGSGKVPVGVNTSETEFNTVEKTGGSKTSSVSISGNTGSTAVSGSVGGTALTIAQMPHHTHKTERFSKVDSVTPSKTVGVAQRANTEPLDVVTNYDISTMAFYGQLNVLGTGGDARGITQEHSHSFSGNSHSHTFSASSSSSTLQPYITCYMWKRVS